MAGKRFVIVVVTLFFVEATAVEYRWATGMRKDYNAAQIVGTGMDSVAWFDIAGFTGRADVVLHFVQQRGDGMQLRYTKRTNVKYNRGVLALVYKSQWRALAGCKYAPYLESVQIDVGRSGHKCRFSKFSLQGYGASSDTIRYCSTDQYRSCSAWRCKCKNDSTMQMLLLRADNRFSFPRTVKATTSYRC